ncbi:efflux RND transporter periplasmic adaptor subunit [Ancylobacter sp. Lp-2]|uniref:efflux RND transporter periplasmic adaptor subunit n=1 Tax=Ancylobacter sp. Lp-2 TaxID=2881339 RepID=UPI001E4D9D64|nr:efflux RND transporter periplasmic adaptor subunit [Ancylobacter sp. Lp-2]MCB4770153.1 efflux RND transporter periplasmic adaptor subunit [Ancylobacter sp. Lp-2]
MRTPVTRAVTLAAGLSVAAALAAFHLVFEIPAGLPSSAQAQSPQPAAAPPTVTVAPPVRREIVEWREFAGRFEPSAAVEIRGRVVGHLASIDVEDGALVEAGQLLFTIDPRPYRAALDEARAQLASAAAQVELADLELNRAEQLVSSSAVSQSTLDQRRQQKKAADAARALAEASVSSAEIDLGFTDIRAPFAGRVSNRRLDIGALVSDGAILTTLVALDPLYFVFDISEQDLLAYRQAAESGTLPLLYDRRIAVEARGQADRDWPHKGTVDFVDNRLEAGAGTLRARAVIANADDAVIPGQFGHVRLPFSGSYAAMLVPETALTTDQADRAVFTVAEDGTVASARVQLGPRQDDGLRIVRSGLDPEDRVVVGGLMRVRAGQKVTTQTAEAEPRAAALAPIPAN